MKSKKFNLHICHPWSGDCRMRGVRFNILFFSKFLYIGLMGGQVYRGTYPNGKWVRFDIHDRRIP